jgi:hypothetical protein
VQVALMAVHAAIGDEAEKVQRPRGSRTSLHRCTQRRVRGQLTICDAFVDPGEVLVHDAAGAHVHVPDLGVAHLPGRESHGFP